MLLIQAPGGRLSRSSLAPAHHLAGIHFSVMGMESRGGLAFCHQAWPPRRGGDGGTGEAVGRKGSRAAYSRPGRRGPRGVEKSNFWAAQGLPQDSGACSRWPEKGRRNFGKVPGLAALRYPLFMPQCPQMPTDIKCPTHF